MMIIIIIVIVITIKIIIIMVHSVIYTWYMEYGVLLALSTTTLVGNISTAKLFKFPSNMAQLTADVFHFFLQKLWP